MRFRRIGYRYTEVVGGVARTLTSDTWEAVPPRTLASPFFRPPADVFETDDAHVVVLELPGVSEDEMDVFVHPDALVVSGRRRCVDVDGARWHAAEIRYGPFRFVMPLPADADPAGVDATVDRGLVRVVLRKRALENR
jgi:HSP20 family protein